MMLRNGTPCRNALRRALCALLVTLAAGSASAQKLTAPDRIPANPTAVLSIPDTQALWKELSAAPITKAFSEVTASPAVSDSDAWLRYVTQADQLEKNLGISLWPSELLGKHLLGVDFYVVEKQDKTIGSATVIRFADEAVPHRVLDHLKREATGAKGVSGGYTAETVQEKTLEGRRLITLPAFSLCVTADGPLLIWGTSEDVVAGSLAGKGASMLISEDFTAEMAGLGGEQGQIWMQGDLEALAPVLGSQAGPARQLSIRRGAARVMVAPDAIKLTTFIPLSAMEGLDKRYALAAPPPGDVTIFNFFGDEGLFFFGSNYFDGLTVLDKGLEAVGEIPDSPITRQQVEQQVAASRETLGFDVRNDFLGNLGPDFGFALEQISLPGAEGGKPQLAALLVTKVKNTDRFATVLARLTDMIAPPPPKPDPDAKTTPAPAPPSPLRTEQAEGGTMSVYDSPQLEAFGLRPAWMLSDDGFFLLALTPEGIAAAQGRYRGSAKSLTQSDVYAAVNGRLEASRNSLAILPGPALVSALRANTDSYTGNLTPAQKASTDSLLTLLGAVKSLSSSTIYKREGRKQEVLIGM